MTEPVSLTAPFASTSGLCFWSFPPGSRSLVMSLEGLPLWRADLG